MAAIASADEVGNRRDVMALGDTNDSLKKPTAEEEHQRGAEVDRQKVPPAACRASDGTVERPRRAVHAQGEAVDPRLARGRADDTGATVSDVGNRKKYCDVTRKNGKQRPAA